MIRMMGILLDGHAHVTADNMSVIKNSSSPKSMLNMKKSNSIAYHYVREREQLHSGAIVVSYKPTKTNLADMLTKTLSGPTRLHLAHGRVTSFKVVVYSRSGWLCHATSPRGDDAYHVLTHTNYGFAM
jgi:hypothetical protein